jgi:hypothetical protein
MEDDKKVHRLFEDGRFNREILERIDSVNLAEINGRTALQLNLSSGDLPLSWLESVPTYRIIVNGGARILYGKYWHVYRHEPEPPYFVEVELCDDAGNKEDFPSDWTTLKVVILAGNIEKCFEVKNTS